MNFTNMATNEEKNDFSMMILDRADANDIDCMDAIVSYCDDMDLEVEAAASLVNDVLKARLETEAMDLGYIARSAKLPI